MAKTTRARWTRQSLEKIARTGRNRLPTNTSTKKWANTTSVGILTTMRSGVTPRIRRRDGRLAMSQSVNWLSIHIDDLTMIYRTKFLFAEMNTESRVSLDYNFVFTSWNSIIRAPNMYIFNLYFWLKKLQQSKNFEGWVINQSFCWKSKLLHISYCSFGWGAFIFWFL